MYLWPASLEGLIGPMRSMVTRLKGISISGIFCNGTLDTDPLFTVFWRISHDFQCLKTSP